MFKIEIEPADTLHTKYGNAKLYNGGRYHISTRKEKNHNKFLHRLIFEEFYGSIPSNCHIHHKDCNPRNNCILNLQCLPGGKHTSLHSTGRKHSDEAKRKMSKAHTGKKRPEISGENHPNYGKHLSADTRKKISEKLKGDNNCRYWKGKKRPDMCGKNNPQWKDYARVIRKGVNSQGKQVYALVYKGERIKFSIDKEKLEKIVEKINNGEVV